MKPTYAWGIKDTATGEIEKVTYADSKIVEVKIVEVKR